MDEPQENIISLKRVLDVSAEDAFAAFTDPALLEQWHADQAEVEPFVGGAFRYVTESDPDETAGLHVVSGTFLAFEDNRRIVQAWQYRGPDSPDGDMTSELSVEFTPLEPGRTEITVTEKSDSHRDAESRIFSIEAWDAGLAVLAELLE